MGQMVKFKCLLQVKECLYEKCDGIKNAAGPFLLCLYGKNRTGQFLHRKLVQYYILYYTHYILHVLYYTMYYILYYCY